MASGSLLLFCPIDLVFEGMNKTKANRLWNDFIRIHVKNFAVKFLSYHKIALSQQKTYFYEWLKFSKNPYIKPFIANKAEKLFAVVSGSLCINVFYCN